MDFILTKEEIQLLSRRLYEIEGLIRKDEKFIGFSSRVLDEITNALKLHHVLSKYDQRKSNRPYGEEYYTDENGNIYIFKWEICSLDWGKVGPINKISGLEFNFKIEIYDGDGWRTIDISQLLQMYVKDENKIKKMYKRIIEEFYYPTYIV